MDNLIQLNEIVKTYHVGTVDVHALRGVNLTIKPKEYVSIMGPSGSG